jgi:hypothetical protein
LFPKEEILDKIRASAHTELNTDQANEKAIRNYSSGKDIYFGKQFFKVEVDDTYPTCVYNNLPAWQAYLFT